MHEMTHIDYQELEQIIRGIAPRKKYGYLSYLLSKEHGISLDKEKNPQYDGPFSFRRGYTCYDISFLVQEELLKRGRSPAVVVGEDNKGIFKIHYWCLDDDVLIDATPIFSFVGEKHPEPYARLSEKFPDYSRSCQNPLTVHDGRFLIGLSGGIKMGKEADILQWSADSFNFEFKVTELSSGQYLDIGYMFDISVYRNEYPRGTLPNFSWDDITSLDPITKTVQHTGTFGKERKPDTEIFLESLHKKYARALGIFLHKIAYAK
jgi:hypothetical protein